MDQGMREAVAFTNKQFGATLHLVRMTSEPVRLNDPAVFKDVFILLFSSLPLGGPGEDQDCHFPSGNQVFWADSGPDPGEKYFVFLVWP